MSLAKMMPARAQATPVVVDLDAKSEPMTVKVNGRVYTLNHLLVDEVADAERIRVEIVNAPLEDVKNFSDVCELYYKLTSKFCPEIELQDLKKMNLIQLRKFFNVVVTHLRAETTGLTWDELQAEDEKKKSWMNPAKAEIPSQ